MFCSKDLLEDNYHYNMEDDIITLKLFKYCFNRTFLKAFQSLSSSRGDCHHLENSLVLHKYKINK